MIAFSNSYCPFCDTQEPDGYNVTISVLSDEEEACEVLDTLDKLVQEIIEHIKWKFGGE